MPKMGCVQSRPIKCDCFGKKQFPKDEEYRKRKKKSKIITTLEQDILEITTRQKLAAFTDIFDIAESIALEKRIGKNEVKLHCNEQNIVASLKKGLETDVEEKTNLVKTTNSALNDKDIPATATKEIRTTLKKKACQEKKNEATSIRKAIRPEVHQNNNCKSSLENSVVTTSTTPSCMNCVLLPGNQFFQEGDVTTKEISFEASNRQHKDNTCSTSKDEVVVSNDKQDGISTQVHPGTLSRDFKVASKEKLFIDSSSHKKSPILADQETLPSSYTLMSVNISTNVTKDDQEKVNIEASLQKKRIVDVSTEKECFSNDNCRAYAIENDQELRENRQSVFLEKGDNLIYNKEECFANDNGISTCQQPSLRIDSIHNSKLVIGLLVDEVIGRVIEIVDHQSNQRKETKNDLTMIKERNGEEFNVKDTNTTRHQPIYGDETHEEVYTDITAYLDSSDDEMTTILTSGHHVSSEHSDSEESICSWSLDHTPNNSPWSSCDDDCREFNVNNLGTSQSYAGETSVIVSSGSSLQCDVNSDHTKDFDEDQIKIIADFLYDVNDVRDARGLGPVSTSTAVRFLEARDYDVKKAFQLFLKYMEYQNLFQVKSPFRDPLKDELVSGRFTVLQDSSIKNDETAITIFYAQRLTSRIDHNVVLQSICFQLDEALRTEVIRKNGIILLYDFTNVSYKSSNMRLCVKILNFLKNIYPVKLKTAFIISPPFWFTKTINVLSNFLRELNDVQISNREQLLQCMEGSRIPESFGGTLRHNHVSWINQCLYAHSKRRGFGKEVSKTGYRLVKSSLSAPNSRIGARLQKEAVD